MPIIQIPDLALRLQRNLRLTHLPDSILGQETVPVIIVDDYSAEGAGNACMAAAVVGPTAAENSHVELIRSSDSYRCFVKAVQISASALTYVRIGASTVAIAGGVAQSSTGFTDFDLVGRPATIIEINTSVGLPAPQEIGRVRVDANRVIDVPLNVFLGSVGSFRHKISIGAVSVNIQIAVTFHFDELPPV